MEKHTKICPYCGGEIMFVAKKCKHCGNWLEERPQPYDRRNINSQQSSNNRQIDNKNSNHTDAPYYVFLWLLLPVVIIWLISLIF